MTAPMNRNPKNRSEDIKCFALSLVLLLIVQFLTGCAGIVSSSASHSAPPTPLRIASSSIPAAAAQTPYTVALTATGGTSPYVWSIKSGSLPTGLSLVASSGQISGVTSQVGSFPFSIQVQDSSSPAQAATQALALNVAAATTPVSITTTSLSSGQEGAAYNGTLSATGGTTPYTWSVVSGSLPTGLSLSPSTGQIGGTSTSSGTFSFVAQVKDSSSPAQTATQALSISIAATVPILTITTSSVPNGQQGTTYSSALHASGGTAPLIGPFLPVSCLLGQA